MLRSWLAPRFVLLAALIGGTFLTAAAGATGCTLLVAHEWDTDASALGSSNGGTKGNGSDAGDPLALLGFAPSNIDVTGIDPSNLPDVTVAVSDCKLQNDHLDCFTGFPSIAHKSVAQSFANDHAIDVLYVKSLKVTGGGIITVTSGSPVAIVAFDTIDIEGTINASAQANSAVAGGFGGSEDRGNGGYQDNSGGGQKPSASGAGGGGGGGGYCGNGGAGTRGVSGGLSWATPTLNPLLGGGSGGGAYNGNGAGGGGGGAIQLVARGSITIHGTVVVNGGGGMHGAGGGAGGAILLESAAVSVDGRLFANGGGGGNGDSAGAGGSTDPTRPAAGASDADSKSVGGDGSSATAFDGTPATVSDADAGVAGGGGGGAGIIIVNVGAGQTFVPASPTASSPSLVDSICFKRGHVKPLN